MEVRRKSLLLHSVKFRSSILLLATVSLIFLFFGKSSYHALCSDYFNKISEVSNRNTQDVKADAVLTKETAPEKKKEKEQELDNSDGLAFPFSFIAEFFGNDEQEDEGEEEGTPYWSTLAAAIVELIQSLAP